MPILCVFEIYILKTTFNGVLYYLNTNDMLRRTCMYHVNHLKATLQWEGFLWISPIEIIRAGKTTIFHMLRDNPLIVVIFDRPKYTR